MRRYLVKHAIENVWCNPNQDRQLIFSPSRMTPINGMKNRFRHVNRMIDLPVREIRYHVYNIGQTSPEGLGLLGISLDWLNEGWTSFKDVINNSKTFVSIYTAKGIQLPKFNSYYMFTNERDLIVAVPVDSKTSADLNQENVYLRLYDNAYYQTARANSGVNFLETDGMIVSEMQDILNWQARVAQLRNVPGHSYIYVNGYLVGDVSPLNVQVGDVIEYIHDTSIKRIVTYTVENLHSFRSTLDSKYKYLLHHLDGSNDTIDFQDDIDVHILHQPELGTYKGVYYHRNNQDSHRMVTHRDYSVVVDYFMYLGTSLLSEVNGEVSNVQDLKIQVVVRNSGYYRPLVHDNSRLFELYKLPDAKILQSMTGVNSTLDIWKAEALENNAYVKLMNSRYSQIDMSLVQNAYGYNSISKIVGDTPTRIRFEHSRPVIDLPVALQHNSTAYEYDEEGLFIGTNYHTSGYTYVSNRSLTRTVEMISGEGGETLDQVYGQDGLPIPEYYNYRVYKTTIDGGIPGAVWTDVTDSGLYDIVNRQVVWKDSTANRYLMLRTDRKFLSYTFELQENAGNYYFPLAELVDHGDGIQKKILTVPMGELDIFMNGKSLIEGLDYRVVFPIVHIVNKKYLQEGNQNIHIRYTGFCSSEGKHESIEDHGYIEHGVLSNNNRYDLRDDKVLRICVDGRLYHRDELVFSEHHSGISTIDSKNGLPYQVKDIVVPLKELTDTDTYSLRKLSQAVDKKVSDYMSLQLPQPPRGAVSAIVEPYPVFSPFLSRIVFLMKSGIINEEVMAQSFSDNKILDVCKPFEDLLEFDPIYSENNYDKRYTIVHPHLEDGTVGLTLMQFRFMTRIVNLYAKGLVDLSRFFVVDN
jgi:hypothetical protein